MTDYSKLVKALRACNRIDHVGNCNECYYGSPDAPQPKQYVNGCKRSMCEDAANAIEDLQKTLEAVQKNSGINFRMWKEAQAEVEQLKAEKL